MDLILEFSNPLQKLTSLAHVIVIKWLDGIELFSLRFNKILFVFFNNFELELDFLDHLRNLVTN